MTEGLPAIDAAGWLAGVRRIPSPNCDARPEGEPIRLIVIHSISLPPGQFGGDAIERLFTNRLDPGSHAYFSQVALLKVSAHFLIRRDGTPIQFVSVTERAWHAGASCWQGYERCNYFSIGIELEGDDAQDFGEAQYRQLISLVRLLRQRFPGADVIGHADIAPGRKTDPGPRFEWTRIVALLAHD